LVQNDHLEIFQRIRSKYTDLSPSFRKIADFLLAGYRDAAFLPASRVAAQVDVSESVVVRFAAAIGYSGYPEMLRAIQRIVKKELAPSKRLAEDETTEDRPERKDILRRTIAIDIENLRRTASDPVTLDSFERAAEMLANTTEVFCLGLRGLGSLAYMLGRRLGTTGIRTRVLLRGDADMFEQLNYIKKGNALVAFAFQRYTKRTVDALELANRRGAGTLVITDSLTSPAARIGNVSLICAVKGESFFNSYTSAVSVINALITSVVNRRLKQTRRALEELDELLPDEDFFGRGNGL
jgi:DNA-binding MurR/RpiR family transcriptional regulator